MPCKIACEKTYHHIERIKIISEGIQMINQKIFALGALVSVGLLTGCGASTSATSASTATLPLGVPASFSQATTKWSDVSNGGNTVTAQGFTSEATLVYNTSTAAAPVIDTTGEVKINYNSSGKISGFSIKNNHVDLTWTDGFTKNIGDPSLTVTDGDEADGMIYDPELTSPWDYQTMATWVVTDESEGTGRMGAISVGNHNAVSIPTTSSATFSGKAEGIYLDDAHKFHGVSSDAALTADFVNKTVSFATSNSKIHDLEYKIADQSKSDLDLTGTFSYSSADNNLTASSLTSTTSGWTGGTSSAKFYGPNAEEIGGVFSIRGPGKEAYEGAFGAKQ